MPHHVGEVGTRLRLRPLLQLSRLQIWHGARSGLFLTLNCHD